MSIKDFNQFSKCLSVYLCWELSVWMDTFSVLAKRDKQLLKTNKEPMIEFSGDQLLRLNNFVSDVFGNTSDEAIQGM